VIEVVPYDPEWPRVFEAERVLLERVLAPWLDGGIHHIGSTAVPGLAAKPVIDMLAGVRDLEEARAAFDLLAERGYVYTPHRPRTHRFAKAQTRGLHLTEVGTDLWCERLAFRDALRANPALAAEYGALKLRLAREHPSDLRAYTVAKRPFVARVLAEAGIAIPETSPR
jgi:GrpB-like predicted nucleotidyltransferase (UPF0157 family)